MHMTLCLQSTQFFGLPTMDLALRSPLHGCVSVPSEQVCIMEHHLANHLNFRSYNIAVVMLILLSFNLSTGSCTNFFTLQYIASLAWATGALFQHLHCNDKIFTYQLVSPFFL